jgi:hypothetical protein
VDRSPAREFTQLLRLPAPDTSFFRSVWLQFKTATLGRVIGSAENSRYEVIAALDMLFTGI